MALPLNPAPTPITMAVFIKNGGEKFFAPDKHKDSPQHQTPPVEKVVAEPVDEVQESVPKKPVKDGKGRVHIGSIPAAMKKIMVRTGAGNKDSKNHSSEQLDGLLEEAGVPRTEEMEVGGSAKEGKTRFRATKEAVDYRRKQVLRLVLRGVPKKTIAEHLGVPLRTVYEDMVEVNAEMRRELQNMDYVGYIGMSLAFFEECRNMALRLAGDTKEKSNGVKMQALRTAMEAERNRTEFLTRVGLFKLVQPSDPFRDLQTGRMGSYSDENDANTFLQLIAAAAKSEPTGNPEVAKRES